MRHLLNNNHDEVIQYINSPGETSKTDDFGKTYWFSTPKHPGNEREYTRIPNRIFNGLGELEKLEQLNPQNIKDSRTQSLSTFDWTDYLLELEGKEAVKILLFEFHGIFAQHLFNIGSNTEIKVQLLPLHDGPRTVKAFLHHSTSNTIS